jgi:hypothetical protein
MKRTNSKHFLIILLIILSWGCKEKVGNDFVSDDMNSDYWWPKQPIPDGFVVGELGTTHGENALLHSLTGLVAQAQRQGLTDELIWHSAGSDYPLWYTKLINRTGAEERGAFNVWELLERYADRKIVKGYILYEPETTRKNWEAMNYSYHAAVSYAGIKKAVIIDEQMESKVKEAGLSMILDARNISREEYFEDLKGLLSNEMVITMNPVHHNNSDLAIANKAVMTYGTDDFTEKIMDWAKPVSPVVGWNTGNEDDFTQLPTKYGLFNTASDWCSNLISLSAGSEDATFEKVKTLDPRTIDFEDGAHFHSFVMSDGDNMQWTIGSFVRGANYWGSDLHGDFPVGFTSCPVNLSMMAPDVLDEMGKTQPPHTTVIEYGGGYQYPDMFAAERGADQEEIHRGFARKINIHMKRTGTKVFGFICMDVTSEDAIEAYRIYAEEMEDLTGMFAVQYAPYHGGYGDVIWVKNREGIEIPVVTARYSLWQDLAYAGGGDVTQVSDAINAGIRDREESMDWTVVHAWSNFENPAQPGERAKGIMPVKWCIDKLDEKIKIVSPEELLWRIRMKHNPEQTVEVITN